MKKQIINLFLFLLLLPTSSAQIFIDIEWYDADSLLTILPSQQGIEKVNTLNRLAASLSFEDEKVSTRYADEALALARKIGYQEGVAGAVWNYGRISFYEGN